MWDFVRILYLKAAILVRSLNVTIYLHAKLATITCSTKGNHIVSSRIYVQFLHTTIICLDAKLATITCSPISYFIQLKATILVSSRRQKDMYDSYSYDYHLPWCEACRHYTLFHSCYICSNYNLYFDRWQTYELYLYIDKKTYVPYLHRWQTNVTRYSKLSYIHPNQLFLHMCTHTRTIPQLLQQQHASTQPPPKLSYPNLGNDCCVCSRRCTTTRRR